MQKKVEDFLRATGMHFDRVDLQTTCDEFVAEMKRGLRGEPSSLMMLPTYIRADGKIPAGKEIVVMDAGGTNLRVATVTFDAKGPRVGYFDKSPMPGTTGKLSRDAFFGAFADKLMPVIHKSDTIGFCFSYPTEAQPDRDGRLIHFNKGVQADGVEGTLIGAGLNEALGRRGIPKKHIVLLNDTVATMLGGIAVTQGQVYDIHIGYILGTGTNTCYPERCSNIMKSPAVAAMDGSMVVNMESGGFNRVAQGVFDKARDAATIDPGRHIAEKMVSGAYQSGLIYRTVAGAVSEGLFSVAFAERLEPAAGLSMYDIDQFCFFPYGDNLLARAAAGDEGDALTLFEIIGASFERSARLAAVNFAAILLVTGTGRNPTRPACITAEGTTFYKSKLFKGKLDYYVRSFLNDTLGVHCEFIHAENATLVGTAVAGLLN